MKVSDRIEELANLLKDNSGDLDSVREELKNIIIPKVNRINELMKEASLNRYFHIDGFNGNVKIDNDYDWDGSVLDRKSAILETYDVEFDEFEKTYVALEYFDMSDEELFEILKKESLSLMKFMLDIEVRKESRINELNKKIEKIKYKRIKK